MRTAFLALLFALVFFSAALASLPLAVVLPSGHRIDLGYAEVHGSIWQGRLEGAFVNGVDLGRLIHQLALLPLLRGQAVLDVQATGGAFEGTGQVIAEAEGRLEVRELRATGEAGRLPILLPVAGTIDINIETLSLEQQSCVRAEGSIATDALTRMFTGFSLRGPYLTGPITCEGESVVFLLQGAQDQMDVAIRLTMNLRSRDWRLVSAIAGNPAALGPLLEAHGFTFDGAAYRLDQTGSLGGGGA